MLVTDEMVQRVMQRTTVFKTSELCRAWLKRYCERHGKYPRIARSDSLAIVSVKRS